MMAATPAAARRADRSALTARQETILLYLFETTRITGVQPSLRDICRHFGFHSPHAARGHLLTLARKGWIGPLISEARSVRFLKIPTSGALFRGFVLPEDSP
jgi:SOS-response transcriptional repressor LexA